MHCSSDWQPLPAEMLQRQFSDQRLQVTST
jgi:hypothetical protein